MQFFFRSSPSFFFSKKKKLQLHTNKTLFFCKKERFRVLSFVCTIEWAIVISYENVGWEVERSRVKRVFEAKRVVPMSGEPMSGEQRENMCADYMKFMQLATCMSRRYFSRGNRVPFKKHFSNMTDH